MTVAERSVAWVERWRHDLLTQLQAEQDDGWWTVTDRHTNPQIRIIRYHERHAA